jgi:hypothetical protein
MDLEEYKRYLRNKVRAYAREFENKVIGEFYLDDLSRAYVQAHSISEFDYDLEPLDQLGPDAAEGIREAAYGMKEAIEEAQHDIDQMVGAGWADPGYESSVMEAMENEVLPGLETAISAFKHDALAALSTQGNHRNPHARRRKLHPYGNAEASRRSLHPYGNPLTDDQHYRGAMAGEAYARHHHHEGHKGLSAYYKGGATAHRHAQAGNQWPTLLPEDNPMIPRPLIPTDDSGKPMTEAQVTRFAQGLPVATLPPHLAEVVRQQQSPKRDGKWHRGDHGTYERHSTSSPDPLPAEIIPYKPRSKDPAIEFQSWDAAQNYGRLNDQKIPTGTKWIATVPAHATGMDPPQSVTAHRTLAAAKKAAAASQDGRHSNPWTPAPAGYLSSSYSPPPSPYGAVNVPAGPLASSYSPPPNPLGWPAYESGTLQGPEAHRSHPDQPLWR